MICKLALFWAFRGNFPTTGASVQRSPPTLPPTRVIILPITHPLQNFLASSNHRNLSCHRRQLHTQLQLVPHASRQSSKQRSSPTRGRPRTTFSNTRLQHSLNPAILQTPSSPSLKVKFKNLTNLAVAMPDWRSGCPQLLTFSAPFLPPFPGASVWHVSTLWPTPSFSHIFWRYFHLRMWYLLASASCFRLVSNLLLSADRSHIKDIIDGPGSCGE